MVNQPQHIQLLISMRLMKLHRDGFEGIPYEDLERVFIKYLFKHTDVGLLHQCADFVLNVSTDTIIRYLALDATVQGKKQTLGDVLTEGNL